MENGNILYYAPKLIERGGLIWMKYKRGEE